MSKNIDETRWATELVTVKRRFIIPFFPFLYMFGTFHNKRFCCCFFTIALGAKQ